MATLYNADLKPLEIGTPTHDYSHASKLFLSNNYKLAPKQSFLYYVRLNVNQSILNTLISGSSVASQTSIQQIEAGMLVKRVDLPKFRVNTKTYNAYNRKNIIQTQLEYEQISMIFHDDAADTVTNFWNDYYTYYYRDSDLLTANGNNPYSHVKGHWYDTDLTNAGVYGRRTNKAWGYSPPSEIPFLTSVQIFSLHNKRFTEYELINPFITAWQHGEHDSSLGGGIMQNIMSLSYETVKYKTGYINAIDVEGFATIHYDNVQSPISKSITNIYNENGLVGALAGAPKDLARPGGVSQSNILDQINAGIDLYKNINAANLKNLATQALTSFGISAINQAINSAFGNGFSVPTSADSIIAANNAAIAAKFNQSYASGPTSAPVIGTAAPGTFSIGNTVSTIGGIVGGGFIGAETYKALTSGALGNSFLGRTAATVVSGVVGTVASNAISSGINYASNQISTGISNFLWDSNPNFNDD